MNRSLKKKLATNQALCSQPKYICCPKKGNPRKHIEVCRKCDHNKSCEAYLAYLQPSLPFMSSKP